MRVHHRQQGVALVTALLITALATVIAVTLMSRQYMDVARTGNLIQSDQGYVYALSLEKSFSQLLTEAVQSQQATGKQFDHLPLVAKTIGMDYDQDKGALMMVQDEAALAPFRALPGLEGLTGSLTGLWPEDAKFNLNTLFTPGTGQNPTPTLNPQQRDRLLRLVERVVIQDMGKQVSANDLVEVIVDWMDADDFSNQGMSADTADYMGMSPPFRAANQPMVSLSELRQMQIFRDDSELLKGIPATETTPRIPGLLDYLTVLPSHDTKININNANEKVILSMSRFFTSSNISDILQTVADEAKAFEQLSDFTSDKEISDIKSKLSADDQKLFDDDINNGWDVKTNYLRLKAVVQMGRTTTMLTTLFERDNNNRFVPKAHAMGNDGI